MSNDDFGVQYTAPHTISEWSGEHQSPQPYRVGASFFLPHQCDEWGHRRRRPGH